MKKKLARAGIILAVAVGAFLLFIGNPLHDAPRHRHDPAKVSNREATAIDQTDTSVSMIAMLNAPDAATPCETAFAAIEAEQAAAKLHGGSSMFTWVAPKADFLTQCQAMPADVQQCMMPRYRRDHADACLQKRPASDVLKKLYTGAPIVEPNYGH